MTWQWVVPIVVAAAVAAITPALLLALPSPSDEPNGRPYVPLATPGFAVVAFALMTASGALGVALAPEHLVGGVGRGTAGVLGGMLDARTGYLPAVLMRAGWVLTATGSVVTTAAIGDSQVFIRGAIGALATTALFWVFHRFGGGFGFGDVRLAPIVGATASGLSWSTLAGGLLLGGILGVAWGLVYRALGRGKAFPYGPALVAGPYLALAAIALLPP